MTNRKIGGKLRNMTSIAALSLALTAGFAVADFSAASAAEVNARSMRYYDKAHAHNQDGDTASAVIEYKNAIKSDPNNLEARVELALIYLDQMNGVSAEKELRAARARGMAQDTIIVPLATAMIIQGKNVEVLEELTLDMASGENRIPLAVYRAQAALGVNKVDQAKQELAAVEAEAGEREDVWLVRSWVAQREGDTDEAITYIDKALELDSESSRANLQKAELLRQSQDFEGSVPFYDKALELSPMEIKARLGRGFSNLALQNVDKVLEDADIVLERLKREPNASYLKAVVLAREGKNEEAIEVITNAYRIEENSSAMYLAANLYLNTKQLEQARASINRYLAMRPTSLRGLVVSATIHLQEGEAEEAVDILERVHEAAPDDLRVVVLLANGYADLKEFGKAADLYDIAIQNQPESEDLRYRAAQTRLNEGQVDLAIAGLESIVFSDLSSRRAAVLLFLTHLKQKKVEEAKLALAEIVNLTGQTAESENFNASVSLLENEFAEAETHLRKALELDPEFVIAKINLARLNVQKGETGEAEKLFKEVTALRPDYMPATDGLLDIAREREDKEAVLNILEKAVAADPKSIRANALWVQELINQERPTKAMVAAQEFLQNLPNVPEALDAQAKAQIANGNLDSAVGTYRRLETMLPDNPLVRIRLAETMVAANNPEAAKSVLDEAISIFPEYDLARQKRVMLEQETAGMESAQSLAEGLYAQVKDPLEKLLGLGNVLMALGNETEALKVYRRAYESSGERGGLLSLYRALDRAGEKAEAEKVLRDWLAANPEDSAVQAIFSSWLIQNGRFNDAITETEKLQRLTPEDPIALNNLAWLYDYVGRKDEAETLAKQAHELSPAAGELADTYGWILFKNGKKAQALPKLEDAAKRLPRDKEVQYHYAAALADSGNKREALGLLNKIIDDGAPFQDRDNAIKLRDELLGQ